MRERLPDRPGISRLAEILIAQADAEIEREGGIEVFRDRRTPIARTRVTTEMPLMTTETPLMTTERPLDAGQ